MSERNDIDELFRSSFEGFEVSPPASVKEAVDNAIDGRRKRRLPFWIWLPVLLVSISGFLLLSQQEGQQLPVSSKSDDHSLTNGKTMPGVNRAQDLRQLPQPEAISSDETQLSVPAAAMEPETVVKADRPKPFSNRKKTTKPYASSPFNGKNLHSTTGSIGEDNLLAMADSGSSSVHDSASVPANETKSNAADSFSTTPADSTVTDPSSEQKADSVKPQAADVTEDEKPDELKKWELSLYGGPSLGLNTGNHLEVAEKGSLLLSLEINRYFGNFGVHSGLGYGQRKDELEMEHETTDVTFLGYDSIAIYDPDNPDSIIGYDTIGVYESVTKLEYERSNYAVSSFSIPIGVSWRHRFGTSPFGLRASGQVNFNFQQAKQLSWSGVEGSDTSGAQPTMMNINRVGVSTNLRVHLTYEWQRLTFSAGLAGGMDFRPTVIPEGYTRKRYYLTPQLGLHFAF